MFTITIQTGMAFYIRIIILQQIRIYQFPAAATKPAFMLPAGFTTRMEYSDIILMITELIISGLKVPYKLLNG